MEGIKPELCLQEKYAPHSQCFGCGPANEKGLKIKSFVDPLNQNQVIANWDPKPYHQAFPGVLNGGIIGALLDCHSNWTAAFLLMKQLQLEVPLCTVTAFFNVKLKRPTPMKAVHLVATAQEIEADRALIKANLYCENKLCASCEGLFVIVKEGHPAFHRW